uniref:Uncharacterized protein n=1 Tax=Octopus bimaculoides TaxID=37653 RepID=A0A0L8FH50_OCTBM
MDFEPDFKFQVCKLMSESSTENGVHKERMEQGKRLRKYFSSKISRRNQTSVILKTFIRISCSLFIYFCLFQSKWF